MQISEFAFGHPKQISELKGSVAHHIFQSAFRFVVASSTWTSPKPSWRHCLPFMAVLLCLPFNRSSSGIFFRLPSHSQVDHFPVHTLSWCRQLWYSFYIFRYLFWNKFKMLLTFSIYLAINRHWKETLIEHLKQKEEEEEEGTRMKEVHTKWNSQAMPSEREREWERSEHNSMGYLILPKKDISRKANTQNNSHSDCSNERDSDKLWKGFNWRKRSRKKHVKKDELKNEIHLQQEWTWKNEMHWTNPIQSSWTVFVLKCTKKNERKRCNFKLSTESTVKKQR